MSGVLVVTDHRDSGISIASDYIAKHNLGDDSHVHILLVTKEQLVLLERYGWSEGYLLRLLNTDTEVKGLLNLDIISRSVLSDEGTYCIWKTGSRKIASTETISTQNKPSQL